MFGVNVSVGLPPHELREREEETRRDFFLVALARRSLSQ